MDFRVTHFLVADSTATDGLANAVNSSADGLSIEAIPSGRIGVVNPLAANPTILPDMDGNGGSVAALSSSTPVQFVQGLNTADAIEKELGLIKSGIIDPKKIISVRKMVGSNSYSRQVKTVGSSIVAAAASSIAASALTTSVTPTLNTAYFTAAANGYYVLTSGNGSGNVAAVPTPTTLSVAGATSGTYNFTYFPNLSAGVGIHGFTASDTAISMSKLQTTSTANLGDSLSVEADKDYSLSVRMRSSRANTLSPFGLMRGYSVNASNTFIGTSTTETADKYIGFSVAFGLVKAFALDHQIDEFAKVHAIYSIESNSGDQSFIFTTTGTISATSILSPTQYGVTATVINVNDYNSWHDAIIGLGLTINAPAAYVAGTNYKLSFVIEGLEQPMFNNPADLTLFPYRWDFVKLNVFFQEGPYHDKLGFTGGSAAQGIPLNSGVTTQTPIVFDRTASGAIGSYTTPITFVHIPEVYSTIAASGKDVLTYPGYLVSQGSGGSAYVYLTDIKFPNLTQSEVKYLAHEYQSYSLKYKQQFQGVKYNAMLMDPTQSKVNFNGVYTLYYIEYMPYADFSYTSTQDMPQLTIIAVPQNLTTTINNLDTILSNSPGNVTIAGRADEVVW